MPIANYTPEEVASKGDTIYRQQLQGIVEPEHSGSFLVTDIKTDAYEIDVDDLKATKRLLASYPDAVIYGLRIGFLTAYRIGGRFTVNQK
ncbi:MAG: hypothetical protein F4148_20225 [Caldilineaceae bacterium SB0675_bin_29]|uniref:Uncharacterized protein n=1 Tax=Caldilineaceae bacterium SB0675_bin_29 TaxID=2605266 RepID=A0A6B1G6E9_9CHLR|nr:hypothetical protein [Caldilineaceae bacterium SB0675_bin_29]